ncbi:hypothetical protein [Hydrogenimonas cancrithermarum]|uniref:Uncharacterized protein n=1 Tax=Hydrogenimonas cancrithermarum TaxID=2993563 RepID=A0ABM8FK16_9BACT|nr:hypothetical protein [Hydrogenimonas cancrithermarum]BDY12651.1 hypothetical protein HCR_09630 [Hydrogenimonas cancrithermarum]
MKPIATLALLPLFSFLHGFSADIESLRLYKKSHPAKQIPHEKRANRFLVKFHAIESADFRKIEKECGLLFESCIADGVCIFTTEKALSIENLKKKIDSRCPEIEEIRLYRPVPLRIY